MNKHVTGYEGRFTFWSDGSVTEEVGEKSGASLFRTLPPHSVFPLSGQSFLDIPMSFQSSKSRRYPMAR